MDPGPAQGRTGGLGWGEVRGVGQAGVSQGVREWLSGPHNAVLASWHLPGPAAGGAGHLVQLPAGLRPLPHPEVPVCLPPIRLGLPSPAAVSPQVSAVRDKGTAGAPAEAGRPAGLSGDDGAAGSLPPQGPGTDVQDEGL